MRFESHVTKPRVGPEGREGGQERGDDSSKEKHPAISYGFWPVVYVFFV